MLEPTTIFVATLICLPAVVLASNQSSWLIDYLFFVVALNRGIRRFVDFENGFFNPFSFISLTPLFVGGLTALVVLVNLHQKEGTGFGIRTTRVLKVYGLSITFAFAIGFLNVKLGAIYALGDYLAPLGLIGCGALCSPSQAVVSRWCNSFAISAVVVAVYGLWQFYTIPPWDAFWVTETGGIGYFGLLEPTKMTLFSTMAERGPAAMYLCSGLMIIALRPGTLGGFRWPCALIVAWAMLLTYSRTTVIFAGLAALLFPILNRGSGLLPVLGVLLFAVLGGPLLMNRLPNQATARVATIGAIQDDGSFKGRLVLLGLAARASLSEPLGLGIGSHGLASRINNAKAQGGGDATGYVEIIRTFGWIGFLSIAWVLYQLWRSASELVDAGLDDRNVRIFRAWFIAGIAALFSGNWLMGASFFWVLAGYVIGRLDLESEMPELANQDSTGPGTMTLLAEGVVNGEMLDEFVESNGDRI